MRRSSTTVVIMVGKPSSDSAEVLAREARVVAGRGYEGASVTNLVEATGRLRGSLYGAFGSKAEPFRHAYAEAARSASAEGICALGGGEIAPAEQIYLRLVARAGIATGAKSRETDGGRGDGWGEHRRGRPVDPELSTRCAGLSGLAQWPGRKARGTDLYGYYLAGAFRQGGEMVFWDVADPAKAVVTLLRGDFPRLYVEVDDPEGVVAMVESALVGGGGAQ